MTLEEIKTAVDAGNRVHSALACSVLFFIPSS